MILSDNRDQMNQLNKLIEQYSNHMDSIRYNKEGVGVNKCQFNFDPMKD